MKEFALVISMWGHTGVEWEFIGNQSILKETLSQEQCEFLSHEELWDHKNQNKFYKILIQCYPTDCAGKDAC
tara:strand:- start:742 stop:957 length:216 start_codon:yes stop_codon:yes gene_type:complete